MNRQGFMMPTVLAFIIITSSALVYQSISTVGQLYSLKAEIADLGKVNYAVNIKRVIGQLQFEDKCSYKQELEYQVAGHQMQIASNCIYSHTADQTYSQQIDKLLVSSELSSLEYSQINSNLKHLKSEVDQPNHELKLGEFDQQLKLLTIDYQLAEAQSRVLIVDKDLRIINNMVVK